MASYLKTRHGALKLPAFFPDATRGVVRTLDAQDLAACGVSGFMVNALHLSSHPGTSLVAGMGGIHRFMGWDGPVASDSGGFQVYSLIASASGGGRISQDGFAYRLGAGQKRRRTQASSRKVRGCDLSERGQAILLSPLSPLSPLSRACG